MAKLHYRNWNVPGAQGCSMWNVPPPARQLTPCQRCACALMGCPTIAQHLIAHSNASAPNTLAPNTSLSKDFRKGPGRLALEGPISYAEPSPQCTRGKIFEPTLCAKYLPQCARPKAHRAAAAPTIRHRPPAGALFSLLSPRACRHYAGQCGALGDLGHATKAEVDERTR